MTAAAEFHTLMKKYGVLLSNPDHQEDFVKELSALMNNTIQKIAKRDYKERVLMSIRELEEILILLRELKGKYEGANLTTVEDLIKLDELKQWEFRLTEKILNNR